MRESISGEVFSSEISSATFDAGVLSEQNNADAGSMNARARFANSDPSSAASIYN
jgi:hypothetical protein